MKQIQPQILCSDFLLFQKASQLPISSLLVPGSSSAVENSHFKGLGRREVIQIQGKWLEKLLVWGWQRSQNLYSNKLNVLIVWNEKSPVEVMYWAMSNIIWLCSAKPNHKCPFSMCLSSVAASSKTVRRQEKDKGENLSMSEYTFSALWWKDKTESWVE